MTQLGDTTLTYLTSAYSAMETFENKIDKFVHNKGRW